jgi:hypothetical protein
MSNGELWFVKLPNGDVHHVTLDQLDTAFQAGHIDANTQVLSDGATEWTTLGRAAGLDEAPSAAAPSPTPAPVVVPVAAYARQAAPASYAPRSVPVSYSQPQAPRSAPVSYSQPPRSVPGAYPTPAGSIRPVAMDLGSDLDLDVPFKKRSGKGWMVAVLSVAMVGGGVGFAATNGTLTLGQSTLVGAAAASPPPAAAPLPAAEPIAVAPVVAAPTPAPPAIQAPLAGALPAMDSSLNPRFTEAQKEKLIQADRVREDKAKQASHGYSARSTPTKYKSSSTFTKGGNKFDPLNSDL